MKKGYILAVFFVAIAVTILNTDGVKSNIPQPPPASTGDAYIPNTCARSGCHESFAAQPLDGGFVVNIGLGQPTTPLTSSFQYMPDSTYNIGIVINHTRVRYGFEMSALLADKLQGGTFTLTNNANTSLQALGNNPKRFYVGHKTADANKTWAFKWTAPPADSGSVNFCVSFNVANGDGLRFNDSIFNGCVTIQPFINGIGNILSMVERLNIFPNPVESTFAISFDVKEAAKVSAKLYSLEGKLVEELFSAQLGEGTFSKSFNINQVPPGIYFMKLNAGESSTTQKIIKL